MSRYITQSDPGADGSKIRNISAVSQKFKRLDTELGDVCWDGQVPCDMHQTPPHLEPGDGDPTCGSHVPHVWSWLRHCMTLSTNSLCHEFLIPSQPSRQPSRPGLVQLRKLVCVCDDCKLANMSATLSSSLKKTPRSRSPRPLESWASTSQLVMEWGRRHRGH